MQNTKTLSTNAKAIFELIKKGFATTSRLWNQTDLSYREIRAAIRELKSAGKIRNTHHPKFAANYVPCHYAWQALPGSVEPTATQALGVIPERQVDLAIPAGYCLKETHARKPLPGETYLTTSGAVKICKNPDADILDFPTLGRDRFILKQILPPFEPKRGDFIRFSDSEQYLDNNNGWVGMFVGKTKDGRYIVLENIGVATDLDEALNAEDVILSAWTYARPL